jgi:hypothetical protein
MQPGSFQLYDNGVQAASGAVALGQLPFAVSGFEVKFNGNPTAPQVTNGELDECAVWNIAKYTGNFTPPTNAYNGNEAGLVMLYHFDGNMNGLSTLYNQITNGIPIVNSNGVAPCTASLPVTPGQTICTLTANNTPTAWSVSSQSCANGFAINNSGVLLGGSGAASLSAGTCTVSVQASNVKGASSAQAESVVLSGGSLPAGVTLRAIDGETLRIPMPTVWAGIALGFSRLDRFLPTIIQMPRPMPEKPMLRFGPMSVGMSTFLPTQSIQPSPWQMASPWSARLGVLREVPLVRLCHCRMSAFTWSMNR